MFKNHIILDFEATCVKNGKIFPQEIIEFPSVLIRNNEIISEIQQYVKPKFKPKLSEFCT